MKRDTAELSSLVGSRICHDLISPLGAIGNGVELLNMNGQMMGPEMALISESVENAKARIRFFRIAFGVASTQQMVGRAEILSILNDMTRGSRTQIDWHPGEDLPRAQIKLAFLLLQCFESSMPFGGTLTVTHEADQWHMLGVADKLRVDPAAWAMAVSPGSPEEITPALIHFALVPEVAGAQGRRVVSDLSEDRISVRF